MKATCPSCGCGGSVALFLADADARQAVLAAAKLPSDCGILVLKYIGFFSPFERFLTAARAARLIRECCDMIVNGTVFDRENICPPSHVWAKALEAMLMAEVRRPLKNHHYLLRIVQSLLQKKDDPITEDRDPCHTSPRRRTGSGLRPVSEALSLDLDEIPEHVIDQWIAKAKDALLAQGIHPKFIIKPLLEQRAKELYNDDKEAADVTKNP